MKLGLQCNCHKNLSIMTLIGAFNQALVGAFSVIVKTDGSFAALHFSYLHHGFTTLSTQALFPFFQPLDFLFISGYHLSLRTEEIQK